MVIGAGVDAAGTFPQGHGGDDLESGSADLTEIARSFIGYVDSEVG
jgi:hypothetical protein